MHASNWKKKPLEMLKTERVRNLNFPGKICKILNEAGRDQRCMNASWDASPLEA